MPQSIWSQSLHSKPWFYTWEKILVRKRGEKKSFNVREISRKVAGAALQSQEPKYKSKSILHSLSYPQEERGTGTCGGEKVGRERRHSQAPVFFTCHTLVEQIWPMMNSSQDKANSPLPTRPTLNRRKNPQLFPAQCKQTAPPRVPFSQGDEV